MAKAPTKIELWPVGKPTPYEKNAKIHPTKQVEQLAKVLDRHGFDQPIVVDKHGVVIKGHGRLLAAKHLGLEKVPVVVRDDLSPAQVREARIADNRMAELSSWDDELLGIDMREALELFPDDFDAELLGLKASFVAAHVRLAGEVEEPDTPEPPKNSVTKFGDVWTLGQHVLTCGDSTKLKFSKPHTIFTDPPYGVNYVSRVEERRKDWGGIANDNLAGEELVKFLRAAVPVAEAQFAFVCCNWRSYFDFETAYGKPNTVCVWDKGSFGLGSGYRTQHEFVMFFGTLKRTDLADVWQLNRDSRGAYQHPTQKPVALAAKALHDVDAKDVFDPFGGSGSTLLAAEQLNIPCMSIELEPKYCDVIVQRWEQLTGGKASRAKSAA